MAKGKNTSSDHTGPKPGNRINSKPSGGGRRPPGHGKEHVVRNPDTGLGPHIVKK